MSGALLEISDIHTYYGSIRALKGVSLTVDRGEIVTLIGSNGAGKTTTLKTVIGSVRPLRGAVTFDGQRIDGLSTDRIVRLGISSSLNWTIRTDPLSSNFTRAEARVLSITFAIRRLVMLGVTWTTT